ncbi:MAG: hypothetical protein PHN69_01240 [Candidatus Pacebacteria bacterium]|nr:hypothetical protein [Candidatus Paceibacterota bacterium]
MMTIKTGSWIGVAIIACVVSYVVGDYQKKVKQPASDGVAVSVTSAAKVKKLEVTPPERVTFRSEQDLENPDLVHQRPRPADANQLTFFNDTTNMWVEIREGGRVHFNIKPKEGFDLYCGFKVPITLVIYKNGCGEDREVVGTVHEMYRFENKRDQYGRRPPTMCKMIVIRDPGERSRVPVVVTEEVKNEG